MPLGPTAQSYEFFVILAKAFSVSIVSRRAHPIRGSPAHPPANPRSSMSRPPTSFLSSYRAGEPLALAAARKVVVGVYAATAVLVAAQRGIWGPQHSTFRIFRASFWHLLSGANLYARYPIAQGDAPGNLFKYSPTAALLFAPFALPPYELALLGWSLLSAFMVYRALHQLLEPRGAFVAAVLVYPDLLSSMQACSSNAIVAALIVFAYVATERGQQWRAAISLAAGAAIKLFPLAGLTFALFHPRRRRFVLVFLAVTAIALVLPLLVTTPAELAQQYRWWAVIEKSDAADLAFGQSAMRLLRDWIGGTWPNWPLQLVGTALLLLPAALHRQHWTEPAFRGRYLVSLLAYTVLFNHQAEHASYVIASVGVALWCVAPAFDRRRRILRFVLGLPALAGLGALPLLVAWTAMQVELLRWPREVVAKARTGAATDGAMTPSTMVAARD
jgi:hypothetical protein